MKYLGNGLLASTTDNDRVAIWNVEDGSLVYKFIEKLNYCDYLLDYHCNLFPLPNRKLLSIASGPYRAVIWDLDSETSQKTKLKENVTCFEVIDDETLASNEIVDLVD